MSKKDTRLLEKVHTMSNNPLRNKFIVIPVALLIGLSTLAAGTKYAPQIKEVLNRPPLVRRQVITFPTEAEVLSVIDGDTVYIHNGSKVRYLGINTPEKGKPFYEQATDANKKLVEGKKITLQYDDYKTDQYDRILAWVFVDGKNTSLEMVKLGLAPVALYSHRKPLIYQDQLIKAEQEAKEKKLGIWK